ncbi:MAG: hypothetical protein KDC12_12315 [Flavobacteriales bacterium]|nr:hypothetical protein [Flavobacteriales bacterium]
MTKNILVIAYHFDPSPWIGARRWSKFSACLKQEGLNVHVLTTTDPSLQNQPLNLDVPRKEIPRKYPEILDRTPKGLLDKIRYRIALSAVQRQLPGSFYDRTGGMQSEWIAALWECIEEWNIDTIIASGAPFSLLYYAALVKEKRPEINLVIDLRDPWTWGTIYGMDNLSPDRLKIEQERELFTISQADIFTVPVDAMKQHLSEKYPEFLKKVKCLPHAFDPSELQIPVRTHDHCKMWVYYGTINKEIEEPLRAICLVLSQNPDIRWDIFTGKPEYLHIFEEYGVADQVHFQPVIPSDELFKKLSEYDLFMCPWPDYAADFITTKFIELFASRLPVIHVGKSGILSNFIAENRLGITSMPTEFAQTFGECLNRESAFPDYNSDFDVQPWSYPGETRQLLDWISKI